MATVTKAKIRAEEFLTMDLGEGLQELVRGEVVDVPPAGPRHGSICATAGFLFQSYGRQTGHGYVLSNDSVVVIDEFNVRGADVQYFSEARWPKALVGDAPPPVPPDLIVEVRSPSDRWGDVLHKISDYLKAGVRLVLLLQPKTRTVTLFRDEVDPIILGASDTLDNLPELPDFRCLVGEFFA